eukprot:363863-Chlamydomonas_euryale.AAC.3
MVERGMQEECHLWRVCGEAEPVSACGPDRCGWRSQGHGGKGQVGCLCEEEAVSVELRMALDSTGCNQIQPPHLHTCKYCWGGGRVLANPFHCAICDLESALTQDKPRWKWNESNEGCGWKWSESNEGCGWKWSESNEGCGWKWSDSNGGCGWKWSDSNEDCGWRMKNGMTWFWRSDRHGVTLAGIKVKGSRGDASQVQGSMQQSDTANTRQSGSATVRHSKHTTKRQCNTATQQNTTKRQCNRATQQNTTKRQCNSATQQTHDKAAVQQCDTAKHNKAAVQQSDTANTRQSGSATVRHSKTRQSGSATERHSKTRQSGSATVRHSKHTTGQQRNNATTPQCNTAHTRQGSNATTQRLTEKQCKRAAGDLQHIRSPPNAALPDSWPGS